MPCKEESFYQDKLAFCVPKGFATLSAVQLFMHSRDACFFKHLLEVCSATFWYCCSGDITTIRGERMPFVTQILSRWYSMREVKLGALVPKTLRQAWCNKLVSEQEVEIDSSNRQCKGFSLKLNQLLLEKAFHYRNIQLSFFCLNSSLSIDSLFDCKHEPEAWPATLFIQVLWHDTVMLRCDCSIQSPYTNIRSIDQLIRYEPL